MKGIGAGLITVIVIILLGVFLGGYKGMQTPTPAEDCDSEDWKHYEDECNRWSPAPGKSSQRPVVIRPQKTRR